MCFYEPNLDDSVVSDCDDTHARTDDAIPASCTPGSVLGVRKTGQTFFCVPEDILSGTQPVCPPSPFLAPNIDSESIVDVQTDRSGRTDLHDERFLDERRARHVWAADAHQPERGWLSPVSIRWLTTMMVSVESVEKKVPIVRMRRTRVWNDSTFPKGHSPVTRPSESSPAIVLPAKSCHDGDGLSGRGQCHLYRGLRGQVGGESTNNVPCSTSTLVQNKRIDLPDLPNSTVSETCFVGCVPGPGLASGDNSRALPLVSDDDNMTSLTGYSPAGQVMRCLTSQSPAPIGASEDWGGIRCGTSSQAAWSVGSVSTDHTSDSDDPAEHNMWNPMLELFCHAEIGILMEALADELVLAMIALACHFALDIPCDKK